MTSRWLLVGFLTLILVAGLGSSPAAAQRPREQRPERPPAESPQRPPTESPQRLPTESPQPPKPQGSREQDDDDGAPAGGNRVTGYVRVVDGHSLDTYVDRKRTAIR